MTRFNLDLNLMPVLEILLQEQHVGRAARLLNLSQPAVSGALARLRAHYGDDLFIRRGSRMDPTPFARALRPAVRDFVLAAQHAARSRPAFDAASAGRTFLIVSSDYVSLTYLQGVLVGIPSGPKAVGVEFEPLSVESETRFAAGHADFLISPKNYRHPHAVFARDRLVAIMSSSAAGSLRMVNEATLRRTPQIAPLIGGDIARRLDGLGGALPTAARAPFAMVASMVAQPPCLAVVPERFAKMQARHLPIRILDLPKRIGELTEYIYWRKRDETDPANVWMRRHLLELPRHM